MIELNDDKEFSINDETVLEIERCVNKLWRKYATERKKFKLKTKNLKNNYAYFKKHHDFGKTVIPILHKSTEADSIDLELIKKTALDVIDIENKLLKAATPDKHILLILEDHKIFIWEKLDGKYEIIIREKLNTTATPTIESCNLAVYGDSTLVE